MIDVRRSFPLPDGADPVLVAAAMNPAMSSWVALRRRIDFQAGQSVLVLGATGSAGQMAVQAAKRLGAGCVIAAGRNRERLAALPALQIVGSGQGSVSTAGILAELPTLVDEIGSGALRIDARAVPLADATHAWQGADSDVRVVLTP